MKITSLSLIILFFLGCKSTSVDIEKNVSTEENFNLGMQKIVKKYSVNYGNKLNPHPDTLTYSQIFKLDRRDFLPKLNNLIFDYRSYSPCGGCWTYNMLHVYNDSISFLLPLTDKELYWQISSKENHSLDISKALNFNVELNALILYAHIAGDEKIELLIDEIMRQQKYWKLEISDIPKLTMIAHDLISNDFYSESCRKQLLENVRLTEKKIRENNIVYSDGINISIFSISNAQNVSIQTLNIDCNSMVLY